MEAQRQQQPTVGITNSFLKTTNSFKKIKEITQMWILIFFVLVRGKSNTPNESVS